MGLFPCLFLPVCEVPSLHNQLELFKVYLSIHSYLEIYSSTALAPYCVNLQGVTVIPPSSLGCLPRKGKIRTTVSDRSFIL